MYSSQPRLVGTDLFSSKGAQAGGVDYRRPTSRHAWSSHGRIGSRGLRHCPADSRAV